MRDRLTEALRVHDVDYADIRIEEKKWQFSYNVGPETYGRALEVEFVDEDGNTLDKWQEYYAVAEEYFRVQLHCYQSLPKKHYKVDFWTTYFNQAHWFASEPTDLGVQVTDVEAYSSAQLSCPRRALASSSR